MINSTSIPAVPNDMPKKLDIARFADVTEKQPKPELITIAIPNDANVLPKTKVVNFFIN